MNTNFLNALKAKSSTIQVKKPSKMAHNGSISDSYISDVEAKRISEINGPKIDKLPGGTWMVTPQDVDARIDRPTIYKVERVLNRNRLDVYFDVCPTELQRRNLKDQGFRWNPDKVCWYHKDTLANCKFLESVFNVQGLDTIDSFKVADSETDKSKDEPISNPESFHDESKIDPLLESSEIFREYVRKVNALQAHLGIDTADLTIKAITCLYDNTFN